MAIIKFYNERQVLRIARATYEYFEYNTSMPDVSAFMAEVEDNMAKLEELEPIAEVGL